MVKIEGISLTGAEVARLNNKSVVILGYDSKPMKSFKDPETDIIKHILKVELLENNRKTEFICNWTSMKTLVKFFGDESDDFIGKNVNLVAAKQQVGDKLKDVIYIEDELPMQIGSSSCNHSEREGSYCEHCETGTGEIRSNDLAPRDLFNKILAKNQAIKELETISKEYRQAIKEEEVVL